MKISVVILCAAAVGTVAFPSWPAAIAVACLAVFCAFERFADALAARGSVADIRADIRALRTAQESAGDAQSKALDKIGDRLDRLALKPTR